MSHPKGDETVAKFNEYVKGLRERGERIPTNQLGTPDGTNIARAAGFSRSAFNNNREIQEKLLPAAIEELGLGEYTPQQVKRAAGNPELLDRLRGQLSDLEGKLMEQEIELDDLRALVDTLLQDKRQLEVENERLRAKLDRSATLVETMAMTGIPVPAQL